ncbi:MAG: hypothetical protein ACI8X5_001746, partial [Planctomycetota bacterium]
MTGLDEKSLRDVLFVRAFEQGDSEGEILSLRERESATRETRTEMQAAGVDFAGAEFVRLRAERLRTRIAHLYPAAAHG